MIMTQNNEDIESDCYNSIIDFFQNRRVDKISTEIWKSKTFIKLMKVLERTQNRDLVRNAILIIISLFEDLPPDFYNNQGKNPASLSPQDKERFKTILKSELYNDSLN